MARIDCVVDTNPMASELSRVSTSVNATTAAVVGMKVAVLKAESDAAKNVCQQLNHGFYTLMHSQISQKLVKYLSEVDSLYLKLVHQRKQLTDQRARMERDYGRIVQRYSRLFEGLNRNLRQRIYELDRPLVEFCVKDMDRTSNRPLHLTATVPVMQEEALKASQRVVISDFKKRCEQALAAMTKFLEEMKAQAELAERIMLRQSISSDEEVHCVPVLIMESNFDSSNTRQTTIYGSEEWLKSRDIEDLKAAIRDDSSLKWTRTRGADPELKSEFSRLLSASGCSERVKKMALSLFNASDMDTLKSSRR